MNKMIFILFLSMQSLSFAHSNHNDLPAAQPVSDLSIFHLQGSWKNQDGIVVPLSSLKGEAFLLSMLYMSCETACPLIVDDLKNVAASIEKTSGKKIKVAVFSIDPKRDTTKALKVFYEKRKLPKTWDLFTSDKNTVAELAGALGVRYKRLPSGEFIHSNVIYFANENGEIAASKEGLGSKSEEFVSKVTKILVQKTK